MMQRRIILLLWSALSFFIGQAQSNYDRIHIEESRSEANDFFRKIQLFQDPSTLSFGLSLPQLANENRIGLLDNIYTFDRREQKKPVLLNADVQPPIGMGGRRFFLRFQKQKHPERALLHALVITPRFKVRIFRNDEDSTRFHDTSLPVRTPSYMPGLEWFFSGRSIWNIPKARRRALGTAFDRDDDSTETLLPRIYGYQKCVSNYFSLQAFHHSDGMPEDGGELMLLRGDSVFNTVYGDFGDNLVLGLNYGRIWRDDRLIIRKAVGYFKFYRFNGKRARINNKLFFTGDQEFFLKVGITKHLGSSPILEKLYGNTRLNLKFGWYFAPNIVNLIWNTDTDKAKEKPDHRHGDLYENYYGRARDLNYGDCCDSIFITPRKHISEERWRFVFDLMYILDKPENYRPSIQRPEDLYEPLSMRRLNMKITATWKFPNVPFTAWFIQAGIQGSDEYNVYFQQNMFFWRTGIAFGLFRYDTF